jgi:thioredoxin reductase
MFVILAGEVSVTQHNALGRDQPIVTHHAGSFMGELAQLSGLCGAEPKTDWLSQSHVALDDKGFVRTGAELGDGRHPLLTSRDGVFAIGDVRAGSIKRVAAAVGEGAQVVAALHACLAAERSRAGVAGAGART